MQAKAKFYSHGITPKKSTLMAETPMWKFYYVPGYGNKKWRNYKLISAKPLEGKTKANYWLGVCLADDALAVNRDYNALKKAMPELLALWVLPLIHAHNKTLRGV